LLNQGAAQPQLPSLLAPVPFRYASLCPAQLTVSQVKVRQPERVQVHRFAQPLHA
jgi:hypothetical protein